MRSTLRRACAVAVVTLVLIILSAASLAAKTTTWTNAGPDDLWSTATNWDNGVPVSMDVVTFSAIGGTSTLDIPGLFLNDMDMTGYTGTLTLQEVLIVGAGDLVIDGTLDMNFGAISVAGSIVVDGHLDATGGTIAIGGGFSVDGTLDADGATIDVGGPVTGGSGATLNFGACYLSTPDDVTLDAVASATWSAGGTLYLGGSGSYGISLGPGSNALNDVTLERGSSLNVTQLATTGGAVTIAGNLDIGGGTLSVLAGDLTIDGLVSIASGAGLEGSATGGTITFNSDMSVDGTFASNQPAVELTFPAGIFVYVSNGASFDVSGTAVDPIVLHDDGVAGGGQWVIAYANPADITVDYAEVQDSDAQGPGPIVATNSTDLGNNTNWDFGPKTTTWTDAAAGNSNWSDFFNWDLGVPTDGDIVLFSAIGGTSVDDIPGLTLEEINMNGYLGTLTLSQPLAVTTDALLYGSVDATGAAIAAGGSLNIFGDVDATGASIILGGNLTVAGSLVGHNAVIEVGGSMAGSFGSVITMGAGDLDIHGTSLSSDGTFSWTTGTLTLLGGGLQQIQLGPSAGPLGYVTVNRSSASDETRIATTGSGIELMGELSIDNGTLALYGGDLDVGGTVLVASSCTLRNDATPGIRMTFDGGLLIGGTCTVTADSVTMGFAGGQTVAVSPSGTFQVIGGSGYQRNTLEQDGAPGGAQWLLNIQSGATTTFENVNVQDSDASSGETAVASGEPIDRGNNINWDFNPTGIGDAPLPSVLLLRAAPNPFNPSTTIHYAVPQAGDVSLVIYDVQGRVVRTLFTGRRDAAPYDATWDGRDDSGDPVGSGVYLCRLQATTGSTVQKLVMVK